MLFENEKLLWIWGRGAGIKLFSVYNITSLLKSPCEKKHKRWPEIENLILQSLSSGLGGKVGPVCRFEVLASTRDLKSNKEDEKKTMKCSILGRMWWFILIISFVFHFPFQCGFPPGFPVSTLHTCVTNINNYNNKDTKPIINSNINMRILEI